jgi:hypothetical protein
MNIGKEQDEHRDMSWKEQVEYVDMNWRKKPVVYRVFYGGGGPCK